jgi:hypothetical protein
MNNTKRPLFIAVVKSSLLPSSHALEVPLPPPRLSYIRETVGFSEDEVREKLNTWLAMCEVVAEQGKTFPLLEKGIVETSPQYVTNQYGFLWEYVFTIKSFDPMRNGVADQVYPCSPSAIGCSGYVLDN